MFASFSLIAASRASCLMVKKETKSVIALIKPITKTPKEYFLCSFMLLANLVSYPKIMKLINQQNLMAVSGSKYCTWHAVVSLHHISLVQFFKNSLVKSVLELILHYHF